MKNIILWILCILVGVNLALTFKINNQLTGKTSSQIIEEQANPLPKYVTKEVRTKLADDFLSTYNSNDADAMWNLLGEYVQAQISKEEVEKNMNVLHEIMGTILDAKYMYHEDVGREGNLRFYNLYYKSKLTEKAKISDTATLKITIATDGPDVQFVGFRVDADTE